MYHRVALDGRIRLYGERERSETTKICDNGSGELTNDDDEDNGDINIEVPAGKLSITGFPAGVLVQSGNTAVHSLSTASELASSTGHDELATATDTLQTSLQSVFNITESNVNIYQIQTVNINQPTITEIQNQINNYSTTLEANNVPFFDCKDAFDQCMRDAADTGGQLHCWVLYAGCLSNKVITTFIPLL